MKKVIELALKSGEVTLQGVINLVNCIDANQQERAVMLLTKNDDTPDSIAILQKGLELTKEGKPYCHYTCIGYNYLQDKVVVRERYEGKDNEFTSHVSVGAWEKYRKNYIEQQQKEREEYVKKQQEQQ